jgi:predicted metal-dependent phosphoesterase TrpH
MSIDDLLFYAKRAGLDFLSVTDHDTMDGVTRAAVLGKRYGVSVIPGVEVSCFDDHRGRKVHILCYFPEKPDRLQGLFTQILEGRTRVGKKMMRAVTRYYPVTEEHILRYAAGSKAIYKLHIMQALLDLGYDTAVVGELFRQLFNSRDGLCYREADYYPAVSDALEILRSAGGICVVAHPLLYDSVDLVAELAAAEKIQGLEVYHPSANDAAVAEILQPLAERFGLIKTGGSDFHGFFRDKPCPLATRITYEDSIDALYALKNATAKKKV